MSTEQELDQALLDWQTRLSKREADLRELQANLVEQMGTLTKLAQTLGELDVLLHGKPIASSASGDRPQLRLVGPVREEKT